MRGSATGPPDAGGMATQAIPMMSWGVLTVQQEPDLTITASLYPETCRRSVTPGRTSKTVIPGRNSKWVQMSRAGVL